MTKDIMVNTKNDYLRPRYNKHLERIVELEVEIALQRELDPEEMSAKKPTRFNSAGQPVAFEEITRKEHIAMLEDSLKRENQILRIIESQFIEEK